MTNNTDTRGRDQAKAQAESIAAMVAALNCDYDQLHQLREEREELAEAVTDAEVDHAEAVRTNHVDVFMNQRALDKARDILAAWDDENAEELNTLEHEAGDCTDQDAARERIQEDALSVEVRSGWASLGDTLTPEEFRIVLCTGGPHVEIRGEFDVHGNPYRAWLQFQDWGTPLTQFFDIEEATLLEYCAQFYFGE